MNAYKKKSVPATQRWSRQRFRTAGSAVILTNGLLDTADAKTAHGLVRGTERFDIKGVIDQNHAGRDAGDILDGICRNIPVFQT